VFSAGGLQEAVGPEASLICMIGTRSTFKTHVLNLNDIISVVSTPRTIGQVYAPTCYNGIMPTSERKERQQTSLCRFSATTI
jgi:hypothetical protein